MKPYRARWIEPRLCPACDKVSSPHSQIGLCSGCLKASYRDGKRLVDERADFALAEQRAEHAKTVEPGKTSRLGRPGWVYFFLRADGLIKIGWSQQPDQRVKAFGKGDLLATMPGTLATETQVHRMFADARLDRSEFFAPTPELRDYIEQIAAEAA